MMKNRFLTARRLVLALLSATLLFVLVSCRDAEPVGLQLPATDIGVGRDTSRVDPADSTSDTDTAPATDAPDPSVPVTSTPVTTSPPDTSDSVDTGYVSFPEDGILTICLDAGHGFDGLVMIPNCDKNVPGLLMAAARLNIPTIFVSGGPMLAGRVDGKNT